MPIVNRMLSAPESLHGSFTRAELTSMLVEIENNQANLHRTLEAIKNHDETAVQNLGQIREFVKVRGMHRSG